MPIALNPSQLSQLRTDVDTDPRILLKFLLTGDPAWVAAVRSELEERPALSDEEDPDGHDVLPIVFGLACANRTGPNPLPLLLNLLLRGGIEKLDEEFVLHISPRIVAGWLVHGESDLRLLTRMIGDPLCASSGRVALIRALMAAAGDGALDLIAVRDGLRGLFALADTLGSEDVMAEIAQWLLLLPGRTESIEAVREANSRGLLDEIWSEDDMSRSLDGPDDGWRRLLLHMVEPSGLDPMDHAEDLWGVDQEGEYVPQFPIEPRKVEATPGRNNPCPCGSGRKFKKCCGSDED